MNDHPYLLMFVGMLFAGELVLLPAIYLSVTGRLEFTFVVAVAIAATMVSDFGFYYAGRKFPATALERVPGRTSAKLIKGVDKLFAERGPQVLFFSKFVYGTRILAQILAGIHDMPVRVYLLTNAMGVTALTLTLSGLAWSVAGTARRYADIVDSAEVVFLAFVIVASIAYFSVATLARRRWSQ